MRNRHEPEDAFVDRLEATITHEVRRRNQPGESRRWAFLPASRLATAGALLALVIVSMGIGGAVVAAAYQAQNNEQRNLLVGVFERRLDLARQSLALVEAAHKGDQRRMDVGLMSPADLIEGRIKLAASQAQVNSIELQLAEVRLTGREPLNEISAPLVAGRDFVTERLRTDLSVPVATLDFEKVLLRSLQRMVEVGQLNPAELQMAKDQVADFEVAIETFHRKLDIRQKFLKGEYDAVQADLRVLLAEAGRQYTMLARKYEPALKEIERLQKLFKVGTVTQLDVAEATLRAQQIKLDLMKVEFDLAVIRQRLAGK